MIITEKNTTREHISQEHMNTQQRENASKRHEHTPKGKHNWNWVVFLVFHVHRFSYIWGFLPQKEAKRKEARAHVTCTKTRRKKKLDTHENRRKNNHTEHISKRHMNTQQRENTSKRHENTPKGKHNWKWFVFHFHWFSYIWGFLPQKIGKSTKRRERTSSAQIEAAKRNWTHMKIAEKTPHVNTHWRDTWTHNKGKTHQKGMKTHQKGNTIESDLSFMFIGFLTVGEFFHKKKQSAKRREHMSSAQIDVAKRKLHTHDNHRKKHHTWTHIARTHERTTKGKRIKEAWTHTKRETQLKLSCFSCFSCSSVFLHLGISSTKRGKTQRGESTCHLHKDTSQKETGHTWKSQKEQPHRTHIEKTHEHTTKGKHIQKAWKHTKRETQLKEFCLSFSLVFLHVGISRKEARAHVICTNRRRKKKLDTHENHRRKTPTHENILKSHTNTQQKKKTHFKGMKTHQKGNTIESDLSFIFVGFLTFWISPTNRGKAQRGESTCHLLNGPSNVFDVCSEKFFLSTHQRHWGVHRADDMCLSDRVCADASNRWHVHKWFLGYVRLSACHLALVYIYFGSGYIFTKEYFVAQAYQQAYLWITATFWWLVPSVIPKNSFRVFLRPESHNGLMSSRSIFLGGEFSFPSQAPKNAPFLPISGDHFFPEFLLKKIHVRGTMATRCGPKRLNL